MSWRSLVAGLAVLGALATGCTNPCLVKPPDYHPSIDDLDPGRELDPAIACRPITDALSLPPPATVDNPEQPPRHLTLCEAIALALEHGTVGVPSSLNPGSPINDLVSFQGQGVSGSDSVRVLALEPARVGAGIEGTLAKFDALWVSSMTWTNTDQPLGSPLSAATAGGAPVDSINTAEANLRTSILKPLPTGGVAGITFNTLYDYYNIPSPVNPAYQPTLHFQFEQPLLQNFGVEINQLLASHPGSLLTPFTTVSHSEGILVTRLRFDQARAEFERNIHTLVLNVEAAYWNLYGAYWNLYSREQGLRQATEVWRREDALARAGRGQSKAAAPQARGQYELFRSQRLAALGAVLESERRLRILTGMPIIDGTRLVPIDAPTLAPYHPDWREAVREALASRPELTLARQELKVQQLALKTQQNRLMPDLRFTSTYDYTGIGSRLDGGSPDSALNSLLHNHFQNWSVGLRLEVPIGFRDANAGVRIAQLSLARSFEVLRDQENKAVRYLELEYRQLFELHAQVAIARAQRQAYGEQVEIRFREFLSGRDVPLSFLLDAQRFWADALTSEYNYIVQYNNALASFEYAKGSILRFHNVVIAEGQLPSLAQKRAVVHEQERAAAIVLRERANAVPYAPCDFEKGCPGLPLLPADRAPSLPALYATAPDPASISPEQITGSGPAPMEPAPATGPRVLHIGNQP